MPWADRESEWDSYQAQLGQAMAGYAAISDNGYDVLNIYWSNERHSVWEAMTARLPWLHRFWSPFDSPKLAKMTFRIPAPINVHCQVHKMLVRRYLPRGYWTRVNQKSLLALQGEGRLRTWARQADARLQLLAQRAQQRLGPDSPPANSKTPDQLAAAAFAGPLSSVVRDTLLAEDGFSRELFAPGGLAEMIDKHVAGQGNYLEVLGVLVTIERYRAMMEKTHQMAALARA